MSTREIIEDKIAFVESQIHKARERYGNIGLAQLKEEPSTQDALERVLYVVCQAAIDLAEAVIAYKGFRKPTVMKEAFEILAEQKIISQTLSEELMKMVGFRNVLAHVYEGVDIQILHDVLQNKLSNVQDFLGDVTKLLGV